MPEVFAPFIGVPVENVLLPFPGRLFREVPISLVPWIGPVPSLSGRRIPALFLKIQLTGLGL